MNLLLQTGHLPFISARARTDNTNRVDQTSFNPVTITGTTSAWNTSAGVLIPQTPPFHGPNPPMTFVTPQGAATYTTTSAQVKPTYRLTWSPTSPRQSKTRSQEKATQK